MHTSMPAAAKRFCQQQACGHLTCKRPLQVPPLRIKQPPAALSALQHSAMGGSIRSDAALLADFATFGRLRCRGFEGSLVLVTNVFLKYGLDLVELIVDLVISCLAQLVAHLTPIACFDAKLECSLWHHLLVAFVLLHSIQRRYFTFYTLLTFGKHLLPTVYIA